MRVVTIVGARPQFIKAAPLSRVLRRHHEEILIHTGQHYDAGMSEVFFHELDIPQPDLNLGIGGMSNVEQVSQMMRALHPVLESQSPDWLITYGDTNSTLAGALTGRLLNIPVAHIEAGLRSYNLTMPEETNRVVADRLSSALFCPSDVAASNLAREGIVEQVHVVGDVMVDALLQNRPRASTRLISEYGLESGGYLLATVHRAANTDDPTRLSDIFSAFARLPQHQILMPAHPRLSRALERHHISVSSNVILIPPVGYLDMLGLTSAAQLVLTDSGGLQKEAYILGVPCVTLREETEWVETLQTGWNRLAGTQPERILEAVHAFLATPRGDHPALYGDGRACERIVTILSSLVKNHHR